MSQEIKNNSSQPKSEIQERREKLYSFFGIEPHNFRNVIQHSGFFGDQSINPLQDKFVSDFGKIIIKWTKDPRITRRLESLSSQEIPNLLAELWSTPMKLLGTETEPKSAAEITGISAEQMKSIFFPEQNTTTATPPVNPDAPEAQEALPDPASPETVPVEPQPLSWSQKQAELSKPDNYGKIFSFKGFTSHTFAYARPGDELTFKFPQTENRVLTEKKIVIKVTPKGEFVIESTNAKKINRVEDNNNGKNRAVIYCGLFIIDPKAKQIVYPDGKAEAGVKLAYKLAEESQTEKSKSELSTVIAKIDSLEINENTKKDLTQTLTDIFPTSESVATNKANIIKVNNFLDKLRLNIEKIKNDPDLENSSSESIVALLGEEFKVAGNSEKPKQAIQQKLLLNEQGKPTFLGKLFANCASFIARLSNISDKRSLEELQRDNERLNRQSAPAMQAAQANVEQQKAKEKPSDQKLKDLATQILMEVAHSEIKTRKDQQRAAEFQANQELNEEINTDKALINRILKGELLSKSEWGVQFASRWPSSEPNAHGLKFDIDTDPNRKLELKEPLAKTFENWFVTVLKINDTKTETMAEKIRKITDIKTRVEGLKNQLQAEKNAQDEVRKGREEHSKAAEEKANFDKEFAAIDSQFQSLWNNLIVKSGESKWKLFVDKYNQLNNPKWTYTEDSKNCVLSPKITMGWFEKDLPNSQKLEKIRNYCSSWKEILTAAIDEDNQKFEIEQEERAFETWKQQNTGQKNNKFSYITSEIATQTDFNRVFLLRSTIKQFSGENETGWQLFQNQIKQKLELTEAQQFEKFIKGESQNLEAALCTKIVKTIRDILGTDPDNSAVKANPPTPDSDGGNNSNPENSGENTGKTQGETTKNEAENSKTESKDSAGVGDNETKTVEYDPKSEAQTGKVIDVEVVESITITDVPEAVYEPKSAETIQNCTKAISEYFTKNPEKKKKFSYITNELETWSQPDLAKLLNSLIKSDEFKIEIVGAENKRFALDEIETKENKFIYKSGQKRMISQDFLAGRISVSKKETRATTPVPEVEQVEAQEILPEIPNPDTRAASTRIESVSIVEQTKAQINQILDHNIGDKTIKQKILEMKGDQKAVEKFENETDIDFVNFASLFVQNQNILNQSTQGYLTIVLQGFEQIKTYFENEENTRTEAETKAESPWPQFNAENPKTEKVDLPEKYPNRPEDEPSYMTETEYSINARRQAIISSPQIEKSKNKRGGFFELYSNREIWPKKELSINEYNFGTLGGAFDTTGNFEISGRNENTTWWVVIPAQSDGQQITKKGLITNIPPKVKGEGETGTQQNPDSQDQNKLEEFEGILSDTLAKANTLIDVIESKQWEEIAGVKRQLFDLAEDLENWNKKSSESYANQIEEILDMIDDIPIEPSNNQRRRLLEDADTLKTKLEELNKEIGEQNKKNGENPKV